MLFQSHDHPSIAFQRDCPAHPLALEIARGADLNRSAELFRRRSEVTWAMTEIEDHEKPVAGFCLPDERDELVIAVYGNEITLM